MKSDRTAAMRDRTAHAYMAGVGYIRVGTPPMPAIPVDDARACLPPPPVASNTDHVLQPPSGPTMVMTWGGMEWIPPLGKGKRLAFTAAYLAAHGWSYVGPA